MLNYHRIKDDKKPEPRHSTFPDRLRALEAACYVALGTSDWRDPNCGTTIQHQMPQLEKVFWGITNLLAFKGGIRPIDCAWSIYELAAADMVPLTVHERGSLTDRLLAIDANGLEHVGKRCKPKDRIPLEKVVQWYCKWSQDKSKPWFNPQAERGSSLFSCVVPPGVTPDKAWKGQVKGALQEDSIFVERHIYLRMFAELINLGSYRGQLLDLGTILQPDRRVIECLVALVAQAVQSLHANVIPKGTLYDATVARKNDDKYDPHFATSCLSRAVAVLRELTDDGRRIIGGCPANLRPTAETFKAWLTAGEEQVPRISAELGGPKDGGWSIKIEGGKLPSLRGLKATKLISTPWTATEQSAVLPAVAPMSQAEVKAAILGAAASGGWCTILVREGGADKRRELCGIVAYKDDSQRPEFRLINSKQEYAKPILFSAVISVKTDS